MDIALAVVIIVGIVVAGLVSLMWLAAWHGIQKARLRSVDAATAALNDSAVSDAQAFTTRRTNTIKPVGPVR